VSQQEQQQQEQQQQEQQQQAPGGPQQQQPSWRWEDSPDAVWAYGAFFGTLLLGNLPLLQQYKEGGEPEADCQLVRGLS
jgi:hypothetical protein